MNKYHAKKIRIDGFLFDSQREGFRYVQLKLMLRAGAISNLEIHPVYPLTVNDVLICKYEADFRYIEDGAIITEDVKGPITREYRIKRKLMKALYGIEIFET